MKGVARVVLLVGAVAIGLLFWRSSPRDVLLVYAVDAAGARTLEVEVERGGETLRRAELRLEPGARQARHAVRLPDGRYVLHVTILGDAPPRRIDRELTVTESGTIVVPLGG